LVARTDGERAAAIYSLLGSAKLNGHDPEAFLRDALARIAEHPITRINELLPWHLNAMPAKQLTGNDATSELPAQA
jgi:transposase